jgi:hypothetical protein
MNDLHIESYDAKELEAKKHLLAKRAAAAGGAIALSLSLFALTACPPIIAGGAGAWFHSCTVDECECIDECECPDNDCAEVK